MAFIKNLFAAALLAVLAAGCGTATPMTNLTPRSQVRNANNLYPMEVMWNSRDSAIRKGSVQPYVMVDDKLVPMRPVEKVPGRWEALVPVPNEKEFVNYRYKFEYIQNGIPNAKAGSQMSAPYQLRVLPQ